MPYFTSTNKYLGCREEEKPKNHLWHQGKLYKGNPVSGGVLRKGRNVLGAGRESHFFAYARGLMRSRDTIKYKTCV